ncbi:hypothetical protein [Massilia atriviolacea]|nr:hypothetical protein [Massilia atriviolacea]
MIFLSHNSFLARLERSYAAWRRIYPPRAAFRAAWALTDWRLP